jgi:hypothetical protein
MKKWIEISDEYVSKIKDMARRKIRLQRKSTIEVWAYWHKEERCFFWNNGEDAAYMDDKQFRPTHIFVGKA